MIHFLKYLILTLFLFALLNLFRSNMDATVSLKFHIPLIHEWIIPPVSLNYLLLTGFCIGILFAAFIGAFRGRTLREKKRELTALKKVLESDRGAQQEPLEPGKEQLRQSRESSVDSR